MTVLSTEIAGLPAPRRGKVRDVYAVDDDRVLLVASDRLSAFDVVMNEGIPEKGAVLTRLAAFWFGQTGHLVPNHLLSADDRAIRAALESVGATWTPELAGRAMLCRKTVPLKIEAVVRGYLCGSMWKAYKSRPDGGDVWGHALPAVLRESEKLPEAIFTPSTKADAGHDEPMTPSEAEELLGDLYRPVVSAAKSLYAFGAAHCERAGLILADTKFEFGVTDSGELLLIDEALTPDSSRFWPQDSYAPGGSPPSFDKQFVRDFLESVPGWNKQPPPPTLPTEIVEKTAAKYREAYERITGKAWA